MHIVEDKVQTVRQLSSPVTQALDGVHMIKCAFTYVNLSRLWTDMKLVLVRSRPVFPKLKHTARCRSRPASKFSTGRRECLADRPSSYVQPYFNHEIGRAHV